MDIADILERAADLIEPEGAWTQGAIARDASGADLGLSSAPKAVCYCMSGAILKVAGRFDYDAFKAVEKVLPRGHRLIPAWNDARRRTQAQVVAKLREAAAKARQS